VVVCYCQQTCYTPHDAAQAHCYGYLGLLCRSLSPSRLMYCNVGAAHLFLRSRTEFKLAAIALAKLVDAVIVATQQVTIQHPQVNDTACYVYMS
jgi:hypothetical protein